MSAHSSLMMKQRLWTQSDGHHDQSEEYSRLDLLHLLGRTCERGAKGALLIIQEGLEATLTAFHIQLETRGTPEGQDRAWGRSGWERGNKAGEDVSKRGALCRQHCLVLSNGICDRISHFRNSCALIYCTLSQFNYGA